MKVPPGSAAGHTLGTGQGLSQRHLRPDLSCEPFASQASAQSWFFDFLCLNSFPDGKTEALEDWCVMPMVSTREHYPSSLPAPPQRPVQEARCPFFLYSHLKGATWLQVRSGAHLQAMPLREGRGLSLPAKLSRISLLVTWLESWCIS